MAYYDKDFLTFFPTRQGGAQGAAAERMMLDSVGGAMSIRTKIRTNPDGSTTMLKTRGGMPEFTTTPADVVEEEPVHPCDHGLYFDGTDNYGERYAGGPYGIYATGGMLLRTSDNKVVDIAGPKPVWGDAYTLDTDMFSGEYGRFCALETGEVTWAFDWQGVAYYVIASATTISFYIDPSLEAQYHRGTMVVSTNVAGYAATYPSHPRVHAVVDVNSTGQRFIIESYGPPPTAAAGDNEVAHQNRFRVCRPNHLIAAVECWVVPYNNNGTLYFTVEWRDLVVFTDLYTVPVIIEPAIANIPLRPIQTAAETGPGTTVNGSVPSGFIRRRVITDGVVTYDDTAPITPSGVPPIATTSASAVLQVLGAKYKNDEIDFVYTTKRQTVYTSYELDSVQIAITLTKTVVGISTTYTEDVSPAYIDTDPGATERFVKKYGRKTEYQTISVEVAESVGGGLWGASQVVESSEDIFYTHGAGTGGVGQGGFYGWNPAIGPDGAPGVEHNTTTDNTINGGRVLVIRPANKVFGIVEFAGAPLFGSPDIVTTAGSVAKLLGTSTTKLALGNVFTGAMYVMSTTYAINQRSPLEEVISPYIYASEHPTTKALATGVGAGKSVCWV